PVLPRVRELPAVPEREAGGDSLPCWDGPRGVVDPVVEGEQRLEEAVRAEQPPAACGPALAALGIELLEGVLGPCDPGRPLRLGRDRRLTMLLRQDVAQKVRDRRHDSGP